MAIKEKITFKCVRIYWLEIIHKKSAWFCNLKMVIKDPIKYVDTRQTTTSITRYLSTKIGNH